MTLSTGENYQDQIKPVALCTLLYREVENLFPQGWKFSIRPLPLDGVVIAVRGMPYDPYSSTGVPRWEEDKGKIAAMFSTFNRTYINEFTGNVEAQYMVEIHLEGALAPQPQTVN